MTSPAGRRPLPPATESMTLLVAAVILHDRERDQVLLVRRGPEAKFAAGSWDLPVGKAARGESVLHTAVRELVEETGVVARPDDLRVAHVIHSSYGVESPTGFLTVVFVAHAWTGDPVNREPGKHSQVCWVGIEHIPSNFVDTTGTALRRYLDGGAMLSLAGW